MDLPLETVTLPPWDPAAGPEWDEAFEKVDNYLRACRVGSRFHRARLTALILQQALAKQEALGNAPGRPSLATLAIDEGRELITQWVFGLLPPRADDRPHTLPEGFLALYLCDAPMRWPNAFLNPRQVPPGFAETLAARMVKAGPELELSTMVPRPLDRGLIPDLADSAFGTFDRFPLLKTLLLWLVLGGLLVAIFIHTRL